MKPDKSPKKGPKKNTPKRLRFVLKIGSSSLATSFESVVTGLAEEIVSLREEGHSFAIVSSGAIALGIATLGFRSRPTDIAKLQAAAAVGQLELMARYAKIFEALGIPIAQVLLTHADLADRERANNARAALSEIMAAGAIPILNENDSVAVEEIKFGDNDQLAAMVAPLVDADRLVLLSDVAGVLDDKGRRVPSAANVETLLPYVRKPEELRAAEMKDTPKVPRVGTGGMQSKLEAARRATLSGVATVIANARQKNVLQEILAGRTGTLVEASAHPLNARKAWIAFTLKRKGTVIVDGGAKAALSKGKSLLAPGVLGVRGEFAAKDCISICDADGSEVGCGLSESGVADIARLARSEARNLEVIHRDNLIVWPN